MNMIIDKIPVRSLRFRIIAGVFGVLSILVLLMIFNNIYAIHVIRNQVYNTNKKTLSMYMKRVDASFSDVERFLSGLPYINTNLSILENPARKIDLYTTLYRVQENLVQSLPGYSTIDGLFIYSTPYTFFIDAVQVRIPIAQRNSVKKHLISLLNSDFYKNIGQNAGTWFPFCSGDEYYLCRLLKVKNTYIGAWVNVTSLTEELRESGFDGADRIFLCQENGSPLDAFLRKEGITVSTDNILQHFTLSGERNRYLTIVQPSERGPYRLVAIIRDSNILKHLAAFMPIILIIAVGVVLVVGLLALTLNRLMVKPISYLTDAIRSLKSGNLDAKIMEKNPCEEFIEVNQAFSEMTSQIKHLKIDVYEEKIRRQKVQLEFLQQQVAPHFFINCLSTIYSLSSTGKIELVQQMSLALSNHLRYTLSRNATVTIEQELTHVLNYLELCRFRFPNCIICEISLPADIQAARIPPLLLQTFVENTVKHEVIAGQITAIYISGNQFMEEGRKKIHLTIWDTGEGFPPSILSRLCNDNLESLRNDNKIGIYNVVQRLRLIYQDNASIQFKNREDAGAQIDIILPFEGWPEEQKA